MDGVCVWSIILLTIINNFYACFQSSILARQPKKPTSCPQLPEIPHATLSSRRTAIGAVVHFECDNGFMLFGHNNITCTALGMWNGFPPACLGR